jgi:glutamate carboxypeptidase
MLPSEMLALAVERRERAESLLRALVDEPSGSGHREGVARVVDRLARELADLGFQVELVREDGLPRHLVARLRGARAPADARPALLVGHADTVFPLSDGRRFSVDEDGERLRGPGVADMKGGLVVALEALRLLGPGLRSGTAAVDVLVNGDEELGSPSSRDLVRSLARAARAALVYENCDDEEGVIVQRKGLGRARIDIAGRGAHAGVAPEKGASAVVEMARQVLEISRLDDPSRELGVVVGIARGGISRNTVPPSAEVEVDLRFRRLEDGEEALARIHAIARGPSHPGTRASCEGECHRPPMGRPAGDLLERAAAIHEALAGRPLREVGSGGGSDANLAAFEGTPTLDGLGVVGSEIHTRGEWCLRRSIQTRAALSAALIAGLFAEPRAAAAT